MAGNRYILTKTPVSRSWLYQVIDTQTGKVMRQRKSRRTFVAATVFYNHFYGRRSLVFSGDRQRAVTEAMRERHAAQSDTARLHWQERIDRLNTIAYMEERQQ